jgi:hypothetical protein
MQGEPERGGKLAAAFRALMALVFAFALVHFVRRKNSRKSGW